MVRINEGTVGKVTGGKLEEVQDGLYLLQAENKEIRIEIEKGEK